MKQELSQEQRKRLEIWVHGSHFPVFKVFDEGLTMGGDSQALQKELLDLLGDVDDEKKALVRMLLGRTDYPTRDWSGVQEIDRRLKESPTDNPTLEEKLHDQYYQIDLGTWHTVHNIRALLENIGRNARAGLSNVPRPTASHGTEGGD
jgi:hypothetical protein